MGSDDKRPGNGRPDDGVKVMRAKVRGLKFRVENLGSKIWGQAIAKPGFNLVLYLVSR